jgi:hypothetical protein
MTKIEDQLRQELQEIAKRAVPAGLRPLSGPPPRARARRARLLVPATAGMAVVLVLAGLALAGRALPGPGSAGAAGKPGAAGTQTVPGQSAAADPPDFVGLLHARPGVASGGGIVMLSAVTGQVVRSLTDNWLGTPSVRQEYFPIALAPDSQMVFVHTLVVSASSLELRSISVQTRKSSFVAYGDIPAVSPDSRYLAYAGAAGQHGDGQLDLAIRDLATGTTRSIDLRDLMGPLGNAQITWLGDGTQVVVMPQADGDAADNACGRQDSPRGVCLLVVDTGASHLQARRVFVPWAVLHWTGPTPYVLISGLVSGQQTLLLATCCVRSPVLDAVRIDGGTVVRQYAAPLPLPPGAFLEAIAPGGDRVLYLTSRTSHSRPALWVAAPRGGRLVSRHRLFVDTSKVSFSGAAW